MRTKLTVLGLSFFLLSGLVATPVAFGAPVAEKEWTFLVFLNGNNNLDRFGTDDLNEMEQVGSTDQVNVVVQWASLGAKKVRRLLVKKDSDQKNVTSPIVQDMGTVDMGDWKNLVEFVRWGVANYPAKKYFIDVWNHGSGWHQLQIRGLKPNDISFDDISGNFMTTKQLGEAIFQSAAIIGHKVDIYGSDACLMTMLEVADEMSGTAQVFVGSEEVEPAEGWPYDGFLRRWVANPTASAHEVSKILTEEYVKSYQGGTQGKREITFSALDLTHMQKVNTAITELGRNFKTFDTDERKKVAVAAAKTEYFTYRDYGDLLDFLANVKASGIARLDARAVQSVEDAVKDLVVINLGSTSYARAKGVALWLPTTKTTYDTYFPKYRDLNFEKSTDWSSALEHILK